MKNYWKTLGGSLLAFMAWGMLVVAMTSCATAQVRVPVIDLPFTMEHWANAQGYAAFTLCDREGNPVIIMNPRYIKDDKYTLAHEMIHVRQMTEFKGGCKALLVEYRANPVFRFAIEVEASCVTFKMLVADGRDEKILFENMSKFFHEAYAPEGLDFEDMVKLIPCRPGGNHVTRADGVVVHLPQ